MATETILTASSRQDTGKGAARELRRSGKTPAVIYGRGRDPESLTIESTLLSRLLTRISSSTPVDVAVDGRAPVQALVREVQRNPIRPEDIVHVDFYEIHAGEQIEVAVPIHLEGIPEGVRNFGGVLDYAMRELPIKVLPRDIPERIEVDVTALEIGQSLNVRDIELPNAEILADPDQTICSVIAPRVEEEVPVEAEIEEEVAEPEVIGRAKEAEDEDETEPSS